MMDGQTREFPAIHHGQKRRANDNYESDQRLAKRFNLLNLGVCSFSAWLTYLRTNVFLQTETAKFTLLGIKI